MQDGLIEIAIGKSRKETSWKNKEILWSQLVEKLSKEHRTAETYAEYMASNKTRQDEIKDVGGFVGGYLTGGKRKSDSVARRSIITLDLDFAPVDVWDLYTFMYGSAAVMYSTHKHSPENPRYRLVLPLSRPVTSDEYAAISRRIAGDIGIEFFDDTTYQPFRLMYWPSSAKDAEFVFRQQDGSWLDVDQVLNTYKNWKDTSEWPVSNRVSDVIRTGIKKQGDPLEKPGVIGAFCRTYSIQEAIETFLSEEYEPCIDGRYTYKHGSTAAGLVVYEDKFAYSHHSTDPSSGKLCNAFDLVRLHKFGLKDDAVKEGTPTNKLPSFVAMEEFAAKDKATKALLGKERFSSALTDFNDIDSTEEIDTEWLQNLEVDRKGNPYSTIANITLVLRNDVNLKGKFAFDEFEKREKITGPLPWRKDTKRNPYLLDVDDAGLRAYLEKNYELAGKDKINDALALETRANAFHPVKTYLEGLAWDGIPRINTLLIDYMGAADTEYSQTVIRKSLTAAVARIYEPGIKFDYVLTMVGKEGIGKSTLIKKLGGKWFSDTFSTVQGKEAFEQLQGVWLVEIAELSGLKKADVAAVKHFISKCEDNYRRAFDRRVETYPRQCIFFGSTNETNFLQDYTGNRRFWPVNVHEFACSKDVFKDLTSSEIDQIWAEAVKLYKNGETLYLPKRIELMARERQYKHLDVDERLGVVQAYLDMLLPDNWDSMDEAQRRMYIQGDPLSAEGTIQRKFVCVAEIWCECFGYKKGDMTRYNTKDLNGLMKLMPGWEYIGDNTKRFKGYGIQKFYKRKG